MIVRKDENFQGKIDDEDPSKNIICRCEQVTESEILDAIHRGIPVTSIDAVKRRVRAGMGTCQGNFCRPRVKALIAREMNMSLEEITQRGKQEESAPNRVSIKDIRKIDK